jgi:hypothetical protein
MDAMFPSVALVIRLVAGATASAAPSVSWQVAPEVRCPTGSQLQSELDAYVSSLPASDRPEVREVRAEVGRGPSDSTQLRVSVVDPPLSLQRDIAGGGRCEDVAHTIAMLVTAWLLEIKESADQAPSVSFEPATPPIEPAQPAAVSTRAPPPPKAKSPHLDVQLGAGAMVGQSPAAFGAKLVAELRASTLLGVGLQATWLDNTDLNDPSGAGSMQLHRQLFSAYLAMAIPPLNRLFRDVIEIRPFLGPVLWHGYAQSYGYDTTGQQDTLIPGLEGGVLVGTKIVGPVFLSAQVGVVGLAQSISYTVSDGYGGTTTLASLGQWALDTSLGLGIQLF